MEQLGCVSASTIDRLMRSYKLHGVRKPFSTTKPGSLLKGAIPIRTFAEWDDDRPGFIEVDLVAHCGDTVEGFHLNTLTAVGQRGLEPKLSNAKVRSAQLSFTLTSVYGTTTMRRFMIMALYLSKNRDSS